MTVPVHHRLAIIGLFFENCWPISRGFLIIYNCPFRHFTFFNKKANIESTFSKPKCAVFLLEFANFWQILTSLESKILELPYHNSSAMPLIIYHNSYCFVFFSVPIIWQLLRIDEAETLLHNLSSWSSSLNSHPEEVPKEIPIMSHLHQMLK